MYTDTAGNVSQFVWYAPYGEALIDEHTTTYENPFKFSGKELDDITGLYDHGARNRNPITAVWYGVDELFEKFPESGPYGYCGGNPVKYFDPDGRAPDGLLTKVNDGVFGIENMYKIKAGAAHLLSLVSGVDEYVIRSVYIGKKEPGHYVPGYSADGGGGAMTLGESSTYSAIILTPNFFADEPKAYKSHGYGKNQIVWLSILSHEVGHLPQIDDQDGLWSYLGSFSKEYMKNLCSKDKDWHDDVPREKQAEIGKRYFVDFNNYVNDNIKKNGLKELFKDRKIPQSIIINKIDQWWFRYTQSKEYKNLKQSIENENK